jgi:hypothetical protein
MYKKDTTLKYPFQSVKKLIREKFIIPNWLLFRSSKIGLGWAKERFQNKIEREIEVDNKGELIFAIEYSYPSAWLKFKITNMSDIYLKTKRIIAWVIQGGAPINKINWCWQEKILEKKKGSVYTGSTVYNKISNCSPKGNVYFYLYYPLAPYVDFGKQNLGLHGIIEFSSNFGTVIKEFNISLETTEDKCNNALDKWKKDLGSKKTIIDVIAI